MEQRWLLGGLRSGALEEGRERRTRGLPADDETGRTMGPSGGRRDATRTRVSVPGLNMSFGAGLKETLHR